MKKIWVPFFFLFLFSAFHLGFSQSDGDSIDAVDSIPVVEKPLVNYFEPNNACSLPEHRKSTELNSGDKKSIKVSFSDSHSPVGTISLPNVVMEGLESEVELSYSIENLKKIPISNSELYYCINGISHPLDLSEGKQSIPITFEEGKEVDLRIMGVQYTLGAKTVSPWLSIIPPLIAIILALLFKEVIISLFLGILSGSLMVHYYLSGIKGISGGFFAVLDTYIIDSIADKDHISVIVFSLLIGGMVAVISRNGGMQGIVLKISKYAKDPKSGQFATWFLGISIFFDDYANTLIVGNTMRPVTDKLKISREKLSYLVDSTAAPISAIAFVTTWIGAELGFIKDGISGLGLAESESPYNIFIHSLSYSFYPILTLLFMLILIWKNRDFGPMLQAEKRARIKGEVFASKQKTKVDKEKLQELDDLDPVEGVTPWWGNAFFPVLTVILVTVLSLIYTGYDPEMLAGKETGFFKNISTIIGNANSYTALLWASLSGLGVAIILTISQKIMSLENTIATSISGFKTMLGAMIILILAWSLAEITKELNTAGFLTSGLESIGINPGFLPVITFVFAGIVAFSTGSSWGTMAILYPLIIPTAWKLSMEAGLTTDESLLILYNLVSCVLAGSVLGDHCSPISDTTILSSLATNCNHIDHVRTQLPYALTVGTVSIFLGTLPSAFGIPPWVCFILAIGTLFGIVMLIGKEVPTEPSVEKNA